MSKLRKKKRAPKRVLALPDLEQSKAAVLNNLTSKSGQGTYDRAGADFGSRSKEKSPISSKNSDPWFASSSRPIF